MFSPKCLFVPISVYCILYTLPHLCILFCLVQQEMEVLWITMSSVYFHCGGTAEFPRAKIRHLSLAGEYTLALHGALVANHPFPCIKNKKAKIAKQTWQNAAGTSWLEWRTTNQSLFYLLIFNSLQKMPPHPPPQITNLYCGTIF